jgi:3-oxoacyl-[acyl-carrier-protein] synthase-1
MQEFRRVYFSDTIAKTCASADTEELISAIANAQSGIAQAEGFLPEAAACIGRFKEQRGFDELLMESVHTIIERAHITPKRTALFVGSSVGGMQRTEKRLSSGASYGDIDPKFHTIGTVKNLIKAEFEFARTYSFSTACTSSANALGFAFECVRKGIYDDVLVVGADAIALTTVCGFNALGVLSPEVCRPFCASSGGMNVSEGIGIGVVSARESEVEILGAGYSSDAHHMTHPEPEGKGAYAAMSAALACAALESADIDYINAHGTGTHANDTTEAAAIASLFGPHTLASSTKNIIGHTLGAAGILEAIICREAIVKGIVPPNGAISQSVNSGVNFVRECQAKPLKRVMSNSFAFGGNNTSLILGRA